MPRVVLPTFHAGQARVFRARQRFNAVRCGRRWGKDVLQNTMAADLAAKGHAVGLFAPEHKQLVEPYDAIEEMLSAIKAKGSSRSEGVLKTTTGGQVDLWPLNDNVLAGRGREYKRVMINEAAFTKSPQMLNTWRKAIRPTLLVQRGSAWVFSTPAGIDEENFFYAACNDRGEQSEFVEFKEHHAPTSDNPLISAEDLEHERRINHPLVFKQEFLAEFVDWTGVQFFEADRWMVHGMPVPYPERCDVVVAVLDTALKSGQQHDSTGVLYAAVTLHGPRPSVVLLDYEKHLIDGALLEHMLPNVHRRMDELAALCGARHGWLPPFVEDKGSGTILLQQAASRGMPAQAIDSKLTAMGKDERALDVSSYHWQGLCKISGYAFDKLVLFKGLQRNHLVKEVLGFRIGDKDAAKRADDLLDCYCYLLALTLGNREGF